MLKGNSYPILPYFGGKAWLLSWIVITTYICISFFYAYTTPSQPLPYLNVSNIPLIKALSDNSIYPERIIFYWQRMLMSFPFVVLIYSFATPYKIKPVPLFLPEVIIGSLAIIIIFGFIVVPAAIFIMFFTTSRGTHLMDKIIILSCSSQFFLAISGAIILIGFCLIFWMSYIAPTISIIKALVKSQR